MYINYGWVGRTSSLRTIGLQCGIVAIVHERAVHIWPGHHTLQGVFFTARLIPLHRLGLARFPRDLPQSIRLKMPTLPERACFPLLLRCVLDLFPLQSFPDIPTLSSIRGSVEARSTL